MAEQLKTCGIRQSELARATGFSAKHINQVIKGHVGISPELALSLKESLGCQSAEFWCALQAQHDLTVLRASTVYDRALRDGETFVS